MSIDNRLKAAIKKNWLRQEQEQWIYGKLGRINPSFDIDFEVKGRKNFLYVTIRNASGSQTAVPARNDAGVPYTQVIPVKVKLEYGVYVIGGRTGKTDEGVSPVLPPSGIPNHASSHQHLGDDEIATETAGAFQIPKAESNGNLDNGWLNTGHGNGIDADTVDGDHGSNLKDRANHSGTQLASTISDLTSAVTTLVNSIISAFSAKNPPIDADSFVITDSTASNVGKRVTGTNVKAYLKAYFDTLYQTLLSGLAAKNPPIDADSFVITDSVAANVGKRVTGTNVKAYLKTYFDTLYGLLATANTWTQSNIFQQDVTVTGNLIMDGSQDYNLDADSSGRLMLVSQTSGSPASFWMFTKDGDGTDHAEFQMFAKGTPASLTNYERLILGYDAGSLKFNLVSGAGGTGTVRPLALSTGANTDQLLLPINGTLQSASRMGVGVAAHASYMLLVNGGLKIQNAGTVVLAPATDTGNWGFFFANAAETFYFAQVLTGVEGTNGGYLIFQTKIDGGAASEKMRITADGQVAIGLSAVNASILGIKAGASSNDAAVGGVLYVTTTSTGNSGAGEDTLASYTVPANTLAVNNQSLWFEAFGRFTPGNNKTVRVRFGSSGTNLVAATAASNFTSDWVIKGRIIRTGATTQISMAYTNGLSFSGAATDVVTNLNQTLSGAITFSITGEATTNSDVILDAFIVGFDDANT